MKILVVEDEVALSDALVHILKKNNYAAEAVNDGETGFDYAITGIYDLIILDIMLPKMDGITLLKNIRKNKVKTPVILLTAKGELSDKVEGLDSGADDYLSKPFATEELLARIRALSRRKENISEDNRLKFKDISFDVLTLNLSCKERQINLTLKESELLQLLIKRENIITPKDLIIEKLWGFDSEVENNNVEVYISFLRKKLQYLKSETVINTVRGVGYILG